MYLCLQYDRQSLLMMASHQGHFEFVKLLLDKGAEEVNHQNKVSYSTIVVIIFIPFHLRVPDACDYELDGNWNLY